MGSGHQPDRDGGGQEPLLGMFQHDGREDRVLGGALPALSSSKWSVAFVDFVGKCLEKDVNKRWSVSELLNVRLLLGCDG